MDCSKAKFVPEGTPEQGLSVFLSPFGSVLLDLSGCTLAFSQGYSPNREISEIVISGHLESTQSFGGVSSIHNFWVLRVTEVHAVNWK